MSLILTVTQYEGEKIIPSDVYDAIIESFGTQEGSFGEFVKVTFRINVGVYQGTVKSLIASKKLQKTPKGPSKLMNLVETVLGKTINPNESLDLNSLIGKQVRIVLGAPINKDGTDYQKIDQVLPQKI